jgi:hypothetical protein
VSLKRTRRLLGAASGLATVTAHVETGLSPSATGRATVSALLVRVRSIAGTSTGRATVTIRVSSGTFAAGSQGSFAEPGTTGSLRSSSQTRTISQPGPGQVFDTNEGGLEDADNGRLARAQSGRLA